MHMSLLELLQKIRSGDCSIAQLDRIRILREEVDRQGFTFEKLGTSPAELGRAEDCAWRRAAYIYAELIFNGTPFRRVVYENLVEALFQADLTPADVGFESRNPENLLTEIENFAAP